MRSYLLKREQFVQQPADKVFAFFANAANLELLTPAWLHFRIQTSGPINMGVGARISYQIRWQIVPITWVSEITEWDPPRRFADVQLQGPYALWRHTHSYVPEGDGTRIIDKVRYGLPLGPIGRLAHTLKVRGDLQAIFDYRAKRIRQILDVTRNEADASAGAYCRALECTR